MADTNPKDSKTVLLYVVGAVVVLGILGYLATGKLPFINSSSLNSSQTKVSDITINDLVIKAEIADTDSKRQLGLSGRQTLAMGEGLLFVFGQENIMPSFWMKDMNFPIDIIWINDGVIIQIDEAQPESGVADKDLRLYKPGSEVDYVLEVPLGFSTSSNIKVGDSVDLSNL